MSFCIKGIGTAVPRHCITQEDLAEVAGRLCGLTDKQRRMLPTLYRHAGVKKRHSVVLAGPSNKEEAGQSFYRSVDEGNAGGPTTAERMRAYAEHATPLAAQACSAAPVLPSAKLGCCRVAGTALPMKPPYGFMPLNRVTDATTRPMTK